MSGHKPWSEISTKLRADPERRARIEQHEQAIEVELTISAFPDADDATQESIYTHDQELHADERYQPPG